MGIEEDLQKMTEALKRERYVGPYMLAVGGDTKKTVLSSIDLQNRTAMDCPDCGCLTIGMECEVSVCLVCGATAPEQPLAVVEQGLRE